MKKIRWAFVLVLFIVLKIDAQDNLLYKIKDHKSERTNFKFNVINQLDNTSIKDQGYSGTCWSYSANSFLESEVYRKHKRIVNIAEIFTARKTYEEKARLYIVMNGFLNYGEGGEFHDVINIYRKYGAMPQEAYTGLGLGALKNSFNSMQKELKLLLDSVNKQEVPINLGWIQTFSDVLDKYLGEVPETFIYKGKTYTAKSFAEEVIDLNPDDYIEISSFMDYPYYTQFYLPIPDNWSGDKVYNVPMEELTEIIDNALNNGYTVGWATDVTEPYFSWKNGVAYVPDINLYTISSNQKTTMFVEPKPDKLITEEMRQDAFNNKTTTDDHGMHIVGTAKDQLGKEYYIVKNSWGVSNDFQGYLYVTKPYVEYKTIAIMLNKEALPKGIRKRLNI